MLMAWGFLFILYKCPDMIIGSLEDALLKLIFLNFPMIPLFRLGELEFIPPPNLPLFSTNDAI